MPTSSYSPSSNNNRHSCWLSSISTLCTIHKNSRDTNTAHAEILQGNNSNQASIGFHIPNFRFRQENFIDSNALSFRGTNLFLRVYPRGQDNKINHLSFSLLPLIKSQRFLVEFCIGKNLPVRCARFLDKGAFLPRRSVLQRGLDNDGGLTLYCHLSVPKMVLYPLQIKQPQDLKEYYDGKSCRDTPDDAEPDACIELEGVLHLCHTKVLEVRAYHFSKIVEYTTYPNEIANMSSKNLQLLLNYIYTKELPTTNSLNRDTAHKLFEVCRKFEGTRGHAFFKHDFLGCLGDYLKAILEEHGAQHQEPTSSSLLLSCKQSLVLEDGSKPIKPTMTMMLPMNVLDCSSTHCSSVSSSLSMMDESLTFPEHSFDSSIGTFERHNIDNESVSSSSSIESICTFYLE